MAINTGGFQTNVIPNYTPVDPNLVAFNPGAITAGIGQSFDVAKGLAELKIMRQTHEENAKMSAAKNKLLQAQADNQRILADYEAGIAPKKTESANLGFDAASAVSRNTMAVQPGVTEAALRNQGYESRLAPGAFDLAKANQDMLLGAQPFITQSAIDDAKFKGSASTEALRTQRVKQSIASVGLASEEENMFKKAESARISADAELDKAKSERETARSDYSLGKTSKERVQESEINLRNATAEASRANAESIRAKNSTAVKIAELRASQKDKSFNDLKDTSKLANELGRMPVVNPANGSSTTMSQLADQYFQVDSDGNVNVFDKGKFTRDLATMNPQTIGDLNAYQDLQRLRSFLVKDLSESIKVKRTPEAEKEQQANSGTWVIINGKWVLRP